MEGFVDQPAPDGEKVKLIALSNRSGMALWLMDWGATWLSCSVPLSDESHRQVLLASPDFSSHLQQTAYFGATVGRYANRIAHGKFDIPRIDAGTGEVVSGSADSVRVSCNEGPHSLHGGAVGFSSRRWVVRDQQADSVCFELVSHDGDQGYPGELRATTTYALGSDNSVQVRFHAQTSKPCPVNLTNHAYFNLDPHHDSVAGHQLMVDADQFLPVAADGIPSGELRPVADTGFDFRRPKRLGQDLLNGEDQHLMQGYDHAFLLNARVAGMDRPAASLEAGDGRLQMRLYTDKPALQVYSGNYLAETPGADYAAYAGVALETQFLPDSPNHPEYPQASCILLPNDQYVFTTRFIFHSD